MSNRTHPPTRSSTEAGTNHVSMPGPVAIASHTCSGVPGTSIRFSICRCMSGLLDGVGGDDEPVRPALVVVMARDRAGDRRGQLIGERLAVLGRAEAHFGVERQSRLALAQRCDLAD